MTQDFIGLLGIKTLPSDFNLDSKVSTPSNAIASKNPTLTSSARSAKISRLSKYYPKISVRLSSEKVTVKQSLTNEELFYKDQKVIINCKKYFFRNLKSLYSIIKNLIYFRADIPGYSSNNIHLRFLFLEYNYSGWSSIVLKKKVNASPELDKESTNINPIFINIYAGFFSDRYQYSSVLKIGKTYPKVDPDQAVLGTIFIPGNFLRSNNILFNIYLRLTRYLGVLTLSIGAHQLKLYFFLPFVHIKL